MQGEQSPVVESGEWVDDYDMSDDDDYEADLYCFPSSFPNTFLFLFL